jgi:Transposase IS116/IS110/IS902 family
LDPKIAELTAAVEQEARQRPEVLRLMTHPGVGPVTGLAYVQVIGTPDRFPCGKQIGSYIGLIPCEDSSAGKQRLGHLSKQGHALLRYLLGEAAQAAVRCNPHWRRRYMHLAMRRHKNIAKAAMARKLAVRLYWMWRNGWDYSQLGSTIKGSQPAFTSSDAVDDADATDIHSITEWLLLSPSSVIRTAIGPSCDELSPCGERCGFTLFRGNDAIG